jgi:hypothetical protein
MSDVLSRNGLPARKGTREALLWSLVVVFVLSVVTLPSVILAGLLLWRGPVLRRMENLLIVAGALVVGVLEAGSVFTGQARWLATIATLIKGSWWPVPWLSVVAVAAFYYGMGGLLRGSAVHTRVRGHLHAVIKTTRNPLGEETLIPKESAKQNIRVAAPPGGVIEVSADQHRTQFGANESKSFALGIDHVGRPFLLNEDEMGMHSIVLGSTGSGKTVTLKSIAASLMDIGWDGMILDLKEDIGPGGLREFCTEYTSAHSLPYQHLALSEEVSEYWLNPLDGMNADFARDTILSLTPGDDFYWSNINKKTLGQLVNLCYDAHVVDPTQVPYPTIYGVGELLEQGNLAAATKKLRALVVGAGGDESRYGNLKSPDPDAQKSAAGFGAKLTQMYDTIAGRTVLRPGDGRKQIDVTANGLTYIGLDSTGKPDLSGLVSAALLQRMSVYAAQRTTGQAGWAKRRFLIIDEASVVARGILKAMLSKARSAGIVVIVCTQGPDDWIDEQGDDWSEMTQNVNVAIVMAQGSSESAEMCAKYLGEKKKLQRSLSLEEGERTNKATARENIDYIVQPHELRQLGVGEAIVRVNKPHERVSWVAVQQRSAGHSPTGRRLRD